MQIKKIQLDFTHKDGLSSNSYDGIRHIKTLPYLSVVQAVEGNYGIQLGSGQMYNTGSGGFFIAPPDIQQTIIHHADPASKQMVCRWVFLKIRINDLYTLCDLYDFPVLIPEDSKQEMHILFDRLFSAGDLCEEYMCYYGIVRLLLRLSQKKAQTLPQYLDHTLAYIKGNYHRRITVGEIAQNVNLSESYLFSVFKKKMGVSPIAYLNSYRLSVAADELVKTDKSIVQIADLVGIGDPVYFNKQFKKAYQMSPSKYRQFYKAGRA